VKTEHLNAVVACPPSEATHFAPAAFGGRLLLPRGQRARNAALKIFVSQRQRAVGYFQALFNAGSSPTFRLDPAFARAVAPIAEGNDVAIWFGTPGPLNKLSFAVIDPQGHVSAIGKIGNRPATAALLHNEAAWLRRCGSYPELVRHVPKLIATITVGDTPILVQSVVDGKTPRLRPGTAQASFQSTLHALTAATELRIEDSKMWLTIREHLTCVRPSLPILWLERIERGMTRLLDYPDRIAFAAAHRDFTPWNMRLEHGSLRVFDWEYASDEYGTAYDLLHYCLLPRVLRGARPHINVILEQAAATAKTANLLSCYGDQLRTQAIAYFLDVCLFYMASRGGWIAGDKVVEGYGDLLDQLLVLK